MTSTYPSSLDTLATNHQDNVGEVIYASTINDLADAVNKIEAELGTTPSNGFSTVKARLDGDNLISFLDGYGYNSTPGADNTSALGAWLDAMNSSGKVGYMPPGLGEIITGRISKSFAPRIVWGRGTWLQQKAGLTGYTPALWEFKGSISSPQNLNTGSTAAQGTRSITLAAGGVAALGGLADGDIIRIGQNVSWSSSRTTEYMGQGLKVKSVSGDTITTWDTLVFSYSQANGGKVWKITPIKNVYIDDIEIRGRGYPGDVGTETQNNQGIHLIDIFYAKDVYVRARLKKAKSMGLVLNDVFDFDVHVDAEDFAYEAGSTGSYGYGVCVQYCTANGTVEVNARRIRHGFTTNGIANDYSGPNNIIVKGRASECWGHGFDTHGAGSNIIFDNVISIGNMGDGSSNDALRGGGIQIRCPKTTVQGGLIADCPEGIRIEGCTEATINGTTILNSYQHGFTDGTIPSAFRINQPDLMTVPGAANRILIKNVLADDIYANFVRYGGSNSYSVNVWVEDCNIRVGAGNQSAAQAVFRTGGGGGVVISNIHLRNSIIRKHPNATAPCIFYSGATGLANCDMHNVQIEAGIEIFRGGVTDGVVMTPLINLQTGTSYTLVERDAGNIVSMNNGSANTVTVPPESTRVFPVGATIRLRQAGAGTTTVAPGSGVTIQSLLGHTALAGQHASALLVKVGANTWQLSGDIV